MKKMVYLIAALLLAFTCNMSAQETQKLTKTQKRMIQEKLDSLQFVQAANAINEKDFTLEADKVIFKRGQTAFVNSNTNFVSVRGDEATVQVAFNVPSGGPNGIGGITLDGQISSYELKESKKGDLTLTMNVMGVGISARVEISMMKGSNRASVTILPNFNSNRLTLSGVLLPAELSNIFKGTSI